MSPLRTFLTLGRISNLPTVWSNCLAAWWLGGGGNVEHLPWLFSGATFLYVAGMFLNDAFDSDFDRQHRKERPIPSGRITAKRVWLLGFAGLALGLICLFQIGTATVTLGSLLVICILAYDAIHKVITFSPVLMGLCRFLLYLTASSTGFAGITGTGHAIWCGLALAAYVIGLTYLARRESARGAFQYWPLLLLAIPIPLALLMNSGAFREPAWLLSFILALWILRSLRPAFSDSGRNIGRAVSHLLAGIVLVDLLAIAGAPREISAIFLALYITGLVLQRFVPAT